METTPTTEAARAVSKTFQVRLESIHKEFDQEFPQIFVKHYKGKLSEPAPLQAWRALGHVFQLFPKQHAIFRSVVAVLLGEDTRSNERERDLVSINQ